MKKEGRVREEEERSRAEMDNDRRMNDRARSQYDGNVEEDREREGNEEGRAWLGRREEKSETEMDEEKRMKDKVRQTCQENGKQR